MLEISEPYQRLGDRVAADMSDVLLADTAQGIE
jgi:hypothetical protein